LDRVVAELEDALLRSRRPPSSEGHRQARTCKFCGQRANKGYDTCCRACARGRGGGAHDRGCPAAADAAAAAACTELVPASTALVEASDAVDTEGPAGATAPPPSTVGRAQVALRALGLDDEWPTELTMREIRRRYMRESLLAHPDKGPEEEKGWRTARFQELSEAYSTLEALMALQEIAAASGAGSSPAAAGGALPGSSLPLEDRGPIGTGSSLDARGHATASGPMAIEDSRGRQNQEPSMTNASSEKTSKSPPLHSGRSMPGIFSFFSTTCGVVEVADAELEQLR